MVLPLTPHNVTLRYPPTGSPVHTLFIRNGYRQKKPFNILTNASRVFNKTMATTPASYAGPNQIGTFNFTGPTRAWNVDDYLGYLGSNADWFRASQDLALNSAMNRLQGRAYDEQASIGVAIGETREAYKMVSNRLVQLYKGFNSLKRLRFYDAARAFGLVRTSPPKKKAIGKNRKLYWRKHPKGVYYPAPRKLGRQRIRTFAGLVLEYNFGWSPLIKDVQSAIAVLQRDPYMDRKIRGGGTDVRQRSDTYLVSGSFKYRCDHTLKTRATAGGTYRISNPNYDLLDRLGLANLASIALELVPFSFLANYIVNLDEVVRNLSDGYRSNMVDTWYTVKTEATKYYSERRVSNNAVLTDCLSYSMTSFRRVEGLPLYTLRVRQRFITSLTRAVNMSSLLVVLFVKR